MKNPQDYAASTIDNLTAFLSRAGVEHADLHAIDIFGTVCELGGVLGFDEEQGTVAAMVLARRVVGMEC